MAALLASCSHHPAAPMNSGPTIQCPAPQAVRSPNGGPVAVTYPAASVTGGVAPAAVSCDPASGTVFAVGSTPVTCTARDADSRTASCTFTVAVATTPRLDATRFVAFGDSITAGTLPADCGMSMDNCAIATLTSEAQRQLALQRMFENLEESPAAYPRVLEALLAERYPSQSVVVANAGIGGEMVSVGRARLVMPGTLDADQQVLLLMEGANDLNKVNPPVDAIADDLRMMVREGVRRGMTVFLGTLLPERPNACRAGDFCDGVDDTVRLNTRLRAIAQGEGATLVDLYGAFAGQTDTLLSLDGLHPNELGYRKMAELFFAAITQQLEHPSTVSETKRR
jgi:lysophospholipase L1-like esterase